MPLLANVALLTAAARDPKLPSAVLDAVSKHLSEKGEMWDRGDSRAPSWHAEARARHADVLHNLGDAKDSFEIFLHILGTPFPLNRPMFTLRPQTRT
jgi:hypothetical protein